jgi:hypothetical protein
MLLGAYVSCLCEACTGHGFFFYIPDPTNLWEIDDLVCSLRGVACSMVFGLYLQSTDRPWRENRWVAPIGSVKNEYR